jgi:hypothetical protein
MDDSFFLIWDSESTPESYYSFNLGQKSQSRTTSKFKDSCRLYQSLLGLKKLQE